MKLLLGLLLSVSCMGSGKLMFDTNYYLNNNKFGPGLGFSVYEQLLGPISTTFYTGIGTEYPDDLKVHWFVFKPMINVRVKGDLTVSGGYKFESELGENFYKLADHIIVGKMTVDLW